VVAARRAASLLSGEHCFAAVLGDSVAAVVVSNGINNFLSLYNTVLVVRLVLTWFPNTPPAIAGPLRYASLQLSVTLSTIKHATLILHTT
jgi:YggT family protein